MNKLLVSRNGIISDCSDVLIDNRKIILNSDGIYSLEYDDIEDISLELVVNSNVIIYESCFSDKINVNNRYIVNDGRLVVNKFYNSLNVDEKIVIDLLAEGSRIDYNFSNICKNIENYVINVNHLNKGTISNINNKSIALDSSKLNFVINSIVGKDYEDSVLDQNTRIVVFGDSDAKISPNMFIDCDSVSARHGSVIGTFKDDMVFYFQSRGIEYSDCIKLLVKGYLFSNIDADIELREKILNVIDMYWR